MRYAKIVRKDLNDGLVELAIREGKSGTGKTLLGVTAQVFRPFAIQRADEWLAGWLRWDGYKPVRNGDDTIHHWEREDRPVQAEAA